MAKTGPAQDPKGLKSRDLDAIKRWQDDEWAKAPYQFKPQNMVQCERTKNVRRRIALPKELARKRLSLLGNHNCGSSRTSLLIELNEKVWVDRRQYSSHQ